MPARFMLRIEGTENVKGGGGRTAGRAGGEVRPEDFQALMEDFDRKMRVLRTVVEDGNKTFGVDGAEDSNDDADDEDEGRETDNGARE